METAVGSLSVVPRSASSHGKDIRRIEAGSLQRHYWAAVPNDDNVHFPQLWLTESHHFADTPLYVPIIPTAPPAPKHTPPPPTHDMRMLRLYSERDLESLSRDKWGIPDAGERRADVEGSIPREDCECGRRRVGTSELKLVIQACPSKHHHSTLFLFRASASTQSSNAYVHFLANLAHSLFLTFTARTRKGIL